LSGRGGGLRRRCSGFRCGFGFSGPCRGCSLSSWLCGSGCGFRSCGGLRRFACGLRMSCWRCVWCRVRGRSGLVSGLCCLRGTRWRLCCSSSRMRNVWLCPGGSLGRHGTMLQFSDACGRTLHGGMGWYAMIHRREVGLILFRDLLMLLLGRSRGEMRLAGKGLLLLRRSGGNSIGAAVEAGVGVVDDGRVVDDGGVHVGVANDGGVHVDCGCVVGEDAAAPLAAGEAAAAITEAIVHAAVEANLCSPITAMEDILTAVTIAPVPRCPEIAGLGSDDPTQ